MKININRIVVAMAMFTAACVSAAPIGEVAGTAVYAAGSTTLVDSKVTSKVNGTELVCNSFGCTQSAGGAKFTGTGTYIDAKGATLIVKSEVSGTVAKGGKRLICNGGACTQSAN